jgi:hypothetical protein
VGRTPVVAVVLAFTVLIAAGCGASGSDEPTARGKCTTASDVPGELVQVSAVGCDEAAEVAAGYLSEGKVPQSWTCAPLPGKREAVECFVGGCAPPPGAEVEAQTEEGPFFLVKLSSGESEGKYEHVRNCRGLPVGGP